MEIFCCIRVLLSFFQSDDSFDIYIYYVALDSFGSPDISGKESDRFQYVMERPKLKNMVLLKKNLN